jgi:D-glycero-D-manno-heptose 1,7-bisphosphate phosphatase
MGVKSVFLDRDGVINRRPTTKRYVTRPEELEILPRVPEAIQLLNDKHYRVFVVSNQAGISLGLYSEDQLELIHQRMRAELKQRGARVDAIYSCPHGSNSCTCRKPDIGMFLQAQRDFPEVDFEHSIVIGDDASDMKAAARLGCNKVLVGEADESTVRSLADLHITVEFSCPSLLDAVSGFVLPFFGRIS